MIIVPCNGMVPTPEFPLRPSSPGQLKSHSTTVVIISMSLVGVFARTNNKNTAVLHTHDAITTLVVGHKSVTTTVECRH